MLKIVYWILRKLNDGVPSRLEVKHAMGRLFTSGIPLTLKIQESMILYKQGASLEDIAEFHNCTRERVRQHLVKGVWRSYGNSEL